MLDGTHRLVLRAVADGDCEASPALGTLVASGLVERRDDGSCVVTPAGRAALADAASPSSRMERILWRVGVICLGVITVDTVIGWVT